MRIYVLVRDMQIVRLWPQMVPKAIKQKLKLSSVHIVYRALKRLKCSPHNGETH